MIRLYNTPARKAETFRPINEKEVLVYTCGPTVYSYQHIGNYTMYIYWDLLVRMLIESGYSVKRVLNITDVGHLVSDADEGEDKMQKGARRESKTAQEIANFYEKDFLENFRKLNLVEPTKIAEATKYIDEDLELVRILKDKGYTYQIDDGIYYDSSKFPRYSEFAHLNVEDLQAGARVEFNMQKRNVTDFALWKFTQPNERRDMQWITPAELLDDPENERFGFPGWHIECSAIIKKELGNTIDIHTGGIDHIPIHHTNEIAQSEVANDAKLANYWLHGNFITIDGRKISKSLGNTLTFEDLDKNGFSHMDFKMWILQGHYQSERNFTYENLAAAQNRLRSWKNTAALRHQTNYVDGDAELISDSDKIMEAVSDNLNSPLALSIIDEMLLKIQQDIAKISKESITKFFERLDRLFGLNLIDSSPDISYEAKNAIAERQEVRKNGDFEKSDGLRDVIESENGIVLKDTHDGTVWGYDA